MMRSRSRQAALALLAASAFASVSIPELARGTTHTWVPGGGNYYVNGNWSPSGTPGSADVALFDLNASYTVTFPTGPLNPNPNNLRLTVSDGGPTFSLSNHTYTLTATGVSSDPSILVGDAGRPGLNSASLTIQTGSLAGVNAVVGRANVLFGNASGALNVSTGGALSLSQGLFLGFDDNESGRLNITSGGDATMIAAWIGYGAGGSGSVTVSSSGSSMTSSFLNVGVSGDGTMLVNASGAVTNTGEAYIGRFSGSTGHMTVDGLGSTWMNTGTVLQVGGGGAGSLTVQNGGSVSSIDPSIGDGTGSTGSALVTGGGSRWNAIGSSGSVGNFGTGSLTVVAGGSLSIGGTIYVAKQNGSSGNVIVTGSGSKYLGFNMSVGESGTGSLAITSGGIGTLNGSATVGDQTNGRGSVLVDGAGSQWAVDAVIDVGDAGRGTVNITNGGIATTTFSQIGSALNSVGSGTLNVSGAGSSFGTATMSVGAGIGLSGRVSVDNGGSVSIANELLLGPHGTITINGGYLNAGSLTHFGAFDQTGGASAIGFVDGVSTINLSGAGSFTADHVRTDTLIIGGASSVKIRPNGVDAGASVLKNLAILGSVGAWQGKIDLTNNDLVIDYSLSSPIASVIDQLRTARNNGAWNGNGITSSIAAASSPAATTLGVMEGLDYRAIHGAGAPFSGQAVDTTSVLVKYTWYGDTDLNGRVNFDDYVRTDNGFNNHLSGWLNGDFDLNGTVNFDDYVLIDLAFNTQSGTLGRALSFLDGSDHSIVGMSGEALQRVAQDYSRFGDAYARGFLSAVPEPCTLALIGVASSAAMFRRRRRSA
jgi:T5SS/PEP-CTERM-associated repeat protein